MNERIKELAKQARDQTEKGTLFEIGLAEYSEKFAELIVRECTDICEDTRNETVDNASPDYNEGRAMGAELCRNRIYRMIEKINK